MLAGLAAPVKAASGNKVRYGDVAGLVTEYKGREGFEVVSAGGFVLGLLKMAAKASAESREDREVLEIMDHLDRVVVVEYEGADQGVRSSFERKVSAILDDAEKISIYRTPGHYNGWRLHRNTYDRDTLLHPWYLSMEHGSGREH